MTQLVRAAQYFCSKLQLKQAGVMPILTFQSPQTSVVVMLDGSFVYNNRNRVLYASHSNGQTRAKYNLHQPLYYAPPRYPLSTLLLQMAQQPDLSAPLVVSSDLHSSLPQRPKRKRLATHSLAIVPRINYRLRRATLFLVF